MNYHSKPLSLDTWPEFEKLFGSKGACAGCWCQYWRQQHASYVQNKGDGNKEEMYQTVLAGIIPGIMLFEKEEAVAWCAVAPREDFPRLERSRIFKPIDNQAVWSITCFFVDKRHRNKGLSTLLLQAAIDFSKQQGAKILEAYPNDTTQKEGPSPDAFVWTGIASVFFKKGFVEVIRRSDTRPMLRLELTV